MQDDLPQTDQQSSPQEGSLTLPGDPAQTDQFRDNLSLALIGFGCVMLMIVIGRMLRRISQRRQANADTPKHQRPTPTANFGSGATHDRLERLMADGEELTRRLAAILDNKAERLEILIEQAELQAKNLEMAADASRHDAEHHATPVAGLTLTSDPGAEMPVLDPVDPLHRKVYDLADEGLLPVDIARQIDRPTGQVELILALRRA